MNEMVEKVAKAMFGRDIGPAAPGYAQEDYCAFLWSTTPASNRETYRQMAALAIAAMREPTEAMIDQSGGYKGDAAWRAACADMWRQMIDAALADERATP